MGEDGLFKQELIDKVTGKCETHNNKRRMKSRDDLLGEKYRGASELIALNQLEMQNVFIVFDNCCLLLYKYQGCLPFQVLQRPLYKCI